MIGPVLVPQNVTVQPNRYPPSVDLSLIYGDIGCARSNHPSGIELDKLNLLGFLLERIQTGHVGYINPTEQTPDLGDSASFDDIDDRESVKMVARSLEPNETLDIQPESKIVDGPPSPTVTMDLLA